MKHIACAILSVGLCLYIAWLKKVDPLGQNDGLAAFFAICAAVYVVFF